MSDSLRRMIRLLCQLPGIGEKTASRLALFVLASGRDYGKALAGAIDEAIEKIRPCEVCGNLTEAPQCAICTDPRRDPTSICVVEKLPDLIAIEKSQEYRGLYHVLHGVLSPLEGTGPEQIGVAPLLARLPGQVKEIILATSASVEGEATALYLAQRIEPFGIRTSRIASGLPVGGELEYADRGTINRAMSGRREMS